MSFDPDLLELMTDTVVVHPRARADEYGKRAPGGDPYPIACHIEGGAHEVSGGQGGSVTHAAGLATLAGYHPTILTSWEVEVPGHGRVPILGVDHVSDEDGPHHTTVHYGAAGA